MKRFEAIIRDIKSVKIQGATNIAKAGIEAFLISPTKKTAKKILETRPTEPALQNIIKILLKSKNSNKTAKKYIRYLENSNKKIAISGAKLIKNNMSVFTHCHSSSVMGILKYAKKQNKNFIVYSTETRPLYQGKKTAKELAKANIKVIYLPDLAAPDIIKKCDIFLFGSDAFLPKKIINKIGTNMLAEVAKKQKIPCYSCGSSLKFTNKIKMEKRNPKEVWDEREKNIKVLNPAFSEVNEKHITGVISEYGVLPYKNFIKLAKKNIKNIL